MQTESLLSDHAMIDVLQRLHFSESKPSYLLPLDISLLTYLVLRRSIDHEISDSAGTLAHRLCVERQAIGESLDRLQQHGWITVSGRGVGRSKGLSLNTEKFPAIQAVRERISEEAKFIAREYANELQKAGRRRFPKNWISRQFPSAQRIIDKCGGDAALARSMVAFGFTDKELHKSVRTSLYHATLIWPKITRAYQTRLKDIATAQMVTAATEGRTNELTKIQCSEAA